MKAALLGLALVSCTRPSGDFGRAEPSVLHDTIMPAAGRTAAKLRGDPVSAFNLTDDEQLLRNRAWALVRPPWVLDWIGGTLAELGRTRILPETEGRIPADLYYIFLKTDRFQSSDTRYDRIASDATGDKGLIEPFCRIAKRVQRADFERLRLVDNKMLISEEAYEGAKARVWENRALTNWVATALQFRIIAYQRALDTLEIETPTEKKVWKVSTAIRELSGEASLMEADCGVELSEQLGGPYVTNLGTGVGTAVRVDDRAQRRSRIFSGWGTERPAPVK
ncbi:MAG: hypothetical protein HWE23_01595 [Rhodobacteraceae bacterium]|nr:hypothetical protein [Paracoccaceae bacterium]